MTALCALVFDLDRVPPNPKRMTGLHWLAHTTWSHTPESPRWRVVLPLAYPAQVTEWHDVWQRARSALCPEADPSCKDPSRLYFLPAHRPGAPRASSCGAGKLLNIDNLPELPEPIEPSSQRSEALTLRRSSRQPASTRSAKRYMAAVIDKLAQAQPGSRNTALNQAAWTLGRWVAADVLDQRTVEDQLFDAALRNGLVVDDGERQTWATIRSGLSAGLSQPLNE